MEKTEDQTKALIVMDEVDGVGSGDRGGLQALLSILKKTLIPIILIANDVGHRKIQTLKNHSYDLRFQRPGPQEIAKKIISVGNKEGLHVD